MAALPPYFQQSHLGRAALSGQNAPSRTSAEEARRVSFSPAARRSGNGWLRQPPEIVDSFEDRLSRLGLTITRRIRCQQSRAQTSARQSGHGYGFTLIELLVVLTIGALLFIVVPLPRWNSDSAHLREVTNVLLADLRAARRRAISHHGEVRLEFYPTGKGYESIPSAVRRTFEGDTSVTYSSGNPLAVDAESRSLRFYRGGRSNGGTVTVASQSITQHLDVDWLLGQVRIRADER